MQTPPPDVRPSSPRFADLPWVRPFVVAVVLALLWRLRESMLLFFGAVLVAATLKALATPLAERTRLSLNAALWVVIVVFAALLAGVVALLGDPLTAQLQALREQLPKAWQMLRDWLRHVPMGAQVLGALQGLGNVKQANLPWTSIASIASGLVEAASGIVLVVLTGLYLAFDTGLYRNGLVRLFPMRYRDPVADALDKSGRALTRWLLGQGIAMVAVGVSVAIALELLGMQLALAVGLIAGVLEFVPFFGPIASGLLAVLAAFSQGPVMALQVAVLFLVIQQIEGNVLIPLIQRWAVRLPPALGLASVVVFGALFGPLGVVFGTPLMVAVVALVKRLYIERTLEGKAP